MVKIEKNVSKEIAIFVLVLNANFQVGFIIWLSFYLEAYLSEHYPQSFAWEIVLVPLCLVLCVFAFYRLFAEIIAQNKKKNP